ncbi:protein phosphatase 2C 29 isoform X1 [Rhodamnia argentea]|uniref:Protein phosphatase 2C 29 n=1 Tax=Rhodamnia argentea TaxID=178133 RepID=A0A8B8NPX9_9MYRT|nr:protein phosphatase 2C 29 isoform X1 [Rhodamnia argentea]XP_048140886.1 protein phosphatase 2C 29 isoform X1 [Rhodamnia argentea]
MGSGFSCFRPVQHRTDRRQHQPDQSHQPDLIFTATEPLDETLGHSFCYVRSSARFLSPTPSERFVSPTHSLRFDDPGPKARTGPETGFRAISGASVSANAPAPRTVVQVDGLFDDAAEGGHGGAGGSLKGGPLNVFESTSSFCALPLQPAPRGGGEQPASGLMERGGGLFLSGPIERGALSGPLEAGSGAEGSGRVPFSAPLGGVYVRKKRRRKGLSSIKKALYGNFAEKHGPWVVPVLNFVGKKEAAEKYEAEATIVARSEGENVQWALGKAGEDRVHVVVSEEQGWLFVGIYDGFNGPDAPEFLMDNLYRAVYLELQGLFWEAIEEGEEGGNLMNVVNENVAISEEINPSVENLISEIKTNSNQDSSDRGSAKRVTFQSEGIEIRRRRLWEFLAEDDPEDGLDLSGSQRFAFSVDDAISVSNAGSAVNRRWLLLSKLRLGLSKHKDGQVRRLFPWRFGLKEKVEVENRVEERPNKSGRRRKEGPVEHELVLRAMSRALEVTELAYLDMTDKVLDTNPELALMGSCLLVVLMRDEDVYVMNVGDSRAIVAQSEAEEVGSSIDYGAQGGKEPSMEGIVEESLDMQRKKKVEKEGPAQSMRLTALQLSTDHSTSIEEEIIRIRNEHPDDNQCIVNDRLKGRLKVTRAFGAGFLKQPKWNNAVLEVFRNVYIGTAPYLSCSPSLRHHKLRPRDQFLILSSDGLYQYLSNQEVVAYVESFMEKFPDGDPAQHLIEELLSRAAKKAGMDFHELLDIPQGDRRKYHDDVTVMVVSLEGRIWKSSGKYF